MMGYDGLASSVIDYGVVSRSLWPFVERFVVTPHNGHSDHNRLLMVLRLPRADAGGRAGRPAPAAAVVKWDPELRGQYRLLTDEYSQRRVSLMQALSEGALPLSVVAKEWSRVVLDASRTVFGVAGRAMRLYGGRAAKRWFGECKAAHEALNDAMRRGDTNAAQAARPVFDAKKRRVQRRQALCKTRIPSCMM